MPALPEYVSGLNALMSVTLVFVTITGSGLAIARAPVSPSRRLGAWLALSAGTLGWFAAAYFLGKAGVFQARPEVLVPTIPFAILLPIGIGLWALTRSTVITEVIGATPLSWLIGVQAYRCFGFVFLMLWADGFLPGEFALPAGIGDVIVGMLAAAVAAYATAGGKGTTGLAFAWNILGIADLVVAVGTGFLSSPGMFQLLAQDRPNVIITSFPLVMIPAFAVPLSIILHGLSLWKISLLRKEQGYLAPKEAIA